MARGTGMRQNEIIQLEWDDVDLQDGFVRLRASKTKTIEARSVRLPDVIVMLKNDTTLVFTLKKFSYPQRAARYLIGLDTSIKYGKTLSRSLGIETVFMTFATTL